MQSLLSLTCSLSFEDSPVLLLLFAALLSLSLHSVCVFFCSTSCTLLLTALLQPHSTLAFGPFTANQPPPSFSVFHDFTLLSSTSFSTQASFTHSSQVSLPPLLQPEPHT